MAIPRSIKIAIGALLVAGIAYYGALLREHYDYYTGDSPLAPLRDLNGTRVAALGTQLLAALPDSVSCRPHADFSAFQQTYWSAQQQESAPFCLIQPRSADEVATAIKLLKRDYDAALKRKEDPVLFATSSGGHAPDADWSNAHEGITIDMSLLKGVTIGQDRHSAVIGPGARWGDVARTLTAEGLAVAGGRDSSVGVGGLTLGGGISFFSPQVGFVCDNVLAYELVLANGSVVEATAHQHRDLWRALKGGATNFGIVTRFTVRAFQSKGVWGGYFFYPKSSTSDIMRAINEWASPENFDPLAAAPIVSLGYLAAYGFQSSAAFTLYMEQKAWPAAWEPFRRIRRFWSTHKMRTLADASAELESMSAPGDRQLFRTITVKNDLDTLLALQRHYDESVAEAKTVKGVIWAMVFQPLAPTMVGHGNTGGDEINALGLGHRNESLVVVLISAGWRRRDDDEKMHGLARRVLDEAAADAASRGTLDRFQYVNYAGVGQDPISSYGEDAKRFLQQTSRAHDPDGFFQQAVKGGFKLGL